MQTVCADWTSTNKRSKSLAAKRKIGMSNVISFSREEKTPHLTGDAKCVDCQHEWVGVAPVCTIWLECPSCFMMRGRFVNKVVKDRPHWVCNCGCDLFFATLDGFYCPNCGKDQVIE